MCLNLKFTFEGDKEGASVGLFDGGEEHQEGLVGEMLGDLLGLSDGEVE